MQTRGTVHEQFSNVRCISEPTEWILITSNSHQTPTKKRMQSKCNITF